MSIRTGDISKLDFHGCHFEKWPKPILNSSQLFSRNNTNVIPRNPLNKMVLLLESSGRLGCTLTHSGPWTISLNLLCHAYAICWKTNQCWVRIVGLHTCRPTPRYRMWAYRVAGSRAMAMLADRSPQPAILCLTLSPSGRR